MAASRGEGLRTAHGGPRASERSDRGEVGGSRLSPMGAYGCGDGCLYLHEDESAHRGRHRGRDRLARLGLIRPSSADAANPGCMLKTIGIILVVLGILALVIPSIPFTKREKVARPRPDPGGRRTGRSVSGCRRWPASLCWSVGAGLSVVGATRKA